MTDLPPYDHEAEAALLGAVLLVPSIVPKLATDHGLRPEHFYGHRNVLVWGATIAVHDSGQAVDELTVCAELERRGELERAGDRAYVHSLASSVPTVGNYEQYVSIVLELAQLRRIRSGAQEILAGVERRDQNIIARGEAKLVRVDQVEQRTSNPQELAEEIWRHLDGGDPERFAFPFPRLNKLTFGGMRRGQLGLVAGWSSHGKSVLIDQFLESAAAHGLRVHLFINEMSKLERTQRTVARLAGVSFERIMLNTLDKTEQSLIARALERIPFGITDCAGWSAADVAREVRRNRYDIVGIDILNRFPKANERKDLEEISRVLNELAKPSQGNCYVLLGAHLNRNRASQSLVLPFPSLADLRETGMLVNDADHVFFVWRDQDEDTGEPLPSGVVRLSKGRNCRLGGLPVEFKGEYMRFDSGLRPAQAAAA